MARLGMEVKEVSHLEYGVHQPGHEAVSAGMNAQQVEELTVAYIVRWQHRHLTREPQIGWVERFGCLRSEERRAGNEGVSTCRFGWPSDNSKTLFLYQNISY